AAPRGGGVRLRSRVRGGGAGPHPGGAVQGRQERALASGPSRAYPEGIAPSPVSPSMPSLAARNESEARTRKGARGRREEPLNPEAHRDSQGRLAVRSLDWQIWLGPLLALGVGILDAVLQGTRLQLGNAGDLQIVVVVLSTLMGGAVSGFASALVGIAL